LLLPAPRSAAGPTIFNETELLDDTAFEDAAFCPRKAAAAAGEAVDTPGASDWIRTIAPSSIRTRLAGGGARLVTSIRST
jgi:hypothetical protein